MKMLKIRREQMDALNLVAVGGFRERMHTEMAARFPVVLAELRQDGFRATIDDAIERARRYGCDLESEFERFLLILARARRRLRATLRLQMGAGHPQQHRALRQSEDLAHRGVAVAHGEEQERAIDERPDRSVQEQEEEKAGHAQADHQRRRPARRRAGRSAAAVGHGRHGQARRQQRQGAHQEDQERPGHLQVAQARRVPRRRPDPERQALRLPHARHGRPPARRRRGRSLRHQGARAQEPHHAAHHGRRGEAQVQHRRRLLRGLEDRASSLTQSSTKIDFEVDGVLTRDDASIKVFRDEACTDELKFKGGKETFKHADLKGGKKVALWVRGHLEADRTLTFDVDRQKTGTKPHFKVALEHEQSFSFKPPVVDAALRLDVDELTPGRHARKVQRSSATSTTMTPPPPAARSRCSTRRRRW